MATPSTTFNLSGLALRLVRDGILEQDIAERIHHDARQKNRSFFSQVLKRDGLDVQHVIRAASEEFGVPVMDLSALDLEHCPAALVSEKLMRKHGVLPLHKRGSKLFVAVSDPTDTRVLDEIKFHTGLGVEPILVDEAKLLSSMEAALEAQDTTFSDLATDEGLEDIDISAEEKEASAAAGEEDAQIDTPIVRFVNKILLDAINRGASDIHLEPYEKNFRVRYRIDGVLHEIASPPVNLASRITARIKILSRLDIAERRVPQDGRMKMRLSRNRTIDFRVSTLPTLYGEKTAVRLLDTSASQLGVDNLGFEEDQKQMYLDAINRPYGMILVTGPTGSGKTVTLYTALGMLNTPERNLSSVEDPVEINMVGVNQVNINERANLTFASALRAFLRQDPDIIMVGEVRDLETADIAVKAAQTGHLVLSTLHTNDAPGTVNRLLNMGVAPFNVASTVHLIMAQRLARRLCQHCKRPMEIPEPALLAAGFAEDELEELVIHEPVGCDMCTEGYKGRVGIFQVMPLTDEMADLIMQGCNEYDIDRQARKEGVRDLRQSGLKKVRDGITSLAEVERITNL